MHFTARMTCCLALAIALSGCSDFSMPSFSMPKLPGIHKYDVQQGNVITQDMIDQLKPGMTKSQVRFIMGTPLIEDTFNQDRWDYYYSLDPAKGEEVRERVAIFFDNDQLVGFRGDYLPNVSNPEE
jgi:outer membrane protein assembly factor BamE